MSRAALRIIDANLNRAREALRVLEDHTRFVAADPVATARIKSIRHRLRDIASAIGEESLLTARAIETDVGTNIKTSTELARSDSSAVATAAFHRLTESLRSICEYAKVISSSAAQIAEELRYDAYALQQYVLLRSDRVRAFEEKPLYALLTESVCRHDWRDTAKNLIAGGVGCIQLREKRLPACELLARARWLREQTRPAGVLLCINDRPDITALCDADILHLGQDDLAVADAREIVGGRMLIGVSTHNDEELQAALAQPPDYVAVGPMFTSTTKSGNDCAGPAAIARTAAATDLPVVAIGGITLENVDEVLAQSPDSICVCADLLQAEDVVARTRAFVEKIASYRKQEHKLNDGDDA